VIRRITLAAVIGVLAASGAYALIYLFRWEWHRAIITALFFVAAEVGLVASMLMRRLTRLEHRLDELAGPGAHGVRTGVDPAVLARLQETAPPAPRPFAWLDPQSSRLSVFLPFLLGVGALASGLAWAVEQVARRSTIPALERGLARRLAPLSLPAGGLLDPAPPVPPARLQLARRWSIGIPVLSFALVLGLGALTIDWLGDALQTRPDQRRSDVATSIELELRGARSLVRPEELAATLWGTCSHVLHSANGPTTIDHVGPARVELLVGNDIGEHAEARLRGCLQDAVVDRVQARVVRWEAIPAR
jgi:hypothetical protein